MSRVNLNICSVRKLFLAGLLALAADGSAAQPLGIAVFEFELVDTSLEGEMLGRNPEEQSRLGRLADQVREALAGREEYRIVDITPVAEKAAAANLQSCGACDARFAREIGADLAVTGMVYKVSNLILNVSLHVRRAKDGRLLASMNADFRSNTDESWRRSLDWLIRHRLLANLETIAQ